MHRHFAILNTHTFSDRSPPCALGGTQEPELYSSGTDAKLGCNCNRRHGRGLTQTHKCIKTLGAIAFILSIELQSRLIARIVLSLSFPLLPARLLLFSIGKLLRPLACLGERVFVVRLVGRVLLTITGGGTYLCFISYALQCLTLDVSSVSK